MQHHFSQHSVDRDRRAFLRGLASIGTGILVTAVGWPALAALPRRELRFHHTHTNERLSVVYHDEGQYVPGALARIDQYLRDFRTGVVHNIDPALLDQLFTLTTQGSGAGVIEVISGYRSPETNSMLRNRGRGGVASRSLHMDGKAVDMRLTGVDLADLHRQALSLAAGGVGYYPREGFVHLDTGRVRRW